MRQSYFILMLILMSMHNSQSQSTTEQKLNNDQISKCNVECYCSYYNHADAECAGGGNSSAEIKQSDCRSDTKNQKLKDACSNCGCPPSDFKGKAIAKASWAPSGGEMAAKRCPAGQYVTVISGGSGDLVDSIGMKCGDQSNLVKTDLGKMGGGGGAPYSVTSQSGFVELKGDSGRYILSINAIDPASKAVIAKSPDGKDLGSQIGRGQDTAYGASGEKIQYDLKCDAGKKIVGFYGRSGSFIDQLGIICDKI